jgi:hypothetical protein
MHFDVEVFNVSRSEVDLRRGGGWAHVKSQIAGMADNISFHTQVHNTYTSVQLVYDLYSFQRLPENAPKQLEDALRGRSGAFSGSALKLRREHAKYRRCNVVRCLCMRWCSVALPL